jgi:tetratricopeptide (TPR) repeat protein
MMKITAMQLGSHGLRSTVIGAGLVLAALPALAQFPGGVTPPGQPRYKPKPDAPRPGVNAESQRWYEGALQEYNAKRYGNATSMIERSIAADANNPSAWYLAGVLAHTRKDRAAALAAYNRALAIDPRYKKAYGDRALLHEEMGRKDLADADWARMRALR